MSNVRMGWWSWVCYIVGLLGVLGSNARAQWFYEDPNQCGIGQFWYRIVFDSSGKFVEGQGWGYGTGWYYYPNAGVYRQWYYRGPFSAKRSACMTISAGIEPVNTAQAGWADIRFIWAAPAWSTQGLGRPPLPDDVSAIADESQYIGSSYMHSVSRSTFGSAEPVKSCSINGYSPDWVGVEVIGGNIKAMRWVAPQCSEDGLWDYGDAPDSYATCLDSDGARHRIVEGVYLGKSVDTESDAEPGYEADGDDLHGDQDDGVVFLQPLSPGCETIVEVTASTEGYLNAWFDFNHNGTFTDADEQVFTRQVLSAGVNDLILSVPASAAPGWTYARFRFSTNPWIGYKGEAEDGEVEDYKVHLAGECGAQEPGVIPLRDSFDDNAMGRLWYLDATDANSVWLEEVDNHLDLRSTASAAGARAQYVSSYWKLDATADFSLQVNYHFTPVTAQQAWLSVRLTPSASAGDANHMDFDVGSSGGSSRLRYEAANSGSVLAQDSTSRTAESGTLYISYDADADELYVSSTAAGRAHAWKIISGLAKGRWKGAPLSVAIGGMASGLAIDVGQARFDDFTVETGTLSGATAVNRFWSAARGYHFYTTSESERRKLIDKYPDEVWACEGVNYLAFAAAGESGALPVYRFWNRKDDSHFYTISESEKDKLVTRFSETWVFEDIAFYAFPPGQPLPGGVMPVYRFWSPKTGAHFYTMTESEKDKLRTQYSPSVWTYEDIAWYAYP
jgi:hypothetical protein